ncbi:hypothetical protein [Emticicia sp. 17c]|uniref:hypothetical protein n=1 Tax=Emticicia sp. 17c TaxID=3127704 RepID=UPI00301DA7DC
MNNILAQYLFNKEIIYKNPPVQVRPEKEYPTEKKEEIPHKKAIPDIVTPPPAPIPVPAVEIPKPQAVEPIALKLKHRVLIITDVISEDEKTFLSKVLAAVGLSLDHIDLIEIQKTQQIDYQTFIAQKTTDKFISFGIGLSRLKWDLMLVPYQIRHVSGVDFLLANDLRSISVDTDMKKSLWAALQKMFAK